MKLINYLKNKKYYFVIYYFININFIYSQETFPINKISENKEHYIAFINATIHKNASTIIKNGILLIKKDKIIEVGNNVLIPKNSIIYDLKNKHIYPSFIDVYSNFGVNVNQPSEKRKEIYTTTKNGAFYWNENISPEVNPNMFFIFDNVKAKNYLKNGVGVVLTHYANGIIRGRSLAVSLNNSYPHQFILNENVSMNFSLNRGNYEIEYPTSLMGVFALLRQTFEDAKWYSSGGNKIEKNISLEAFNNFNYIPKVFEINKINDIFRVNKLTKEYGYDFIIKSNLDHYQYIDDLKKFNYQYIISLNFPASFELNQIEVLDNIPLKDLKHWEWSRFNPSILEKNNINFYITTDGNEKFLDNLRTANVYGLSKENALKSLTSYPAHLINNPSIIGELSNQSKANFFISNIDIFEKGSEVIEHFIDGEQTLFGNFNNVDIRGNYKFNFENKNYNLSIKGSLLKPKIELKLENSVLSNGTGNIEQNVINFNYDFDTLNSKEKIIFNGKIYYEKDSLPIIEGFLSNTFNDKIFVKIKRINNFDEKDKNEKDSLVPLVSNMTYPFNSFGYIKKPISENVLFKNATIITGEKEGELLNTDLYVKNGKIEAIGKNLSFKDVKIIDATNKYLTAGIIDEHSHIATNSINECSHSNTSEVNMEDAVDPTDIDIYHSLAGGVTTIQLLHGSCNAIGGRSAILKLKWGENNDEIIYKNPPKFIKFALGENVIKVNRSQSTTRFPKTRMGVEQFYIDNFTKAKEYINAKKEYLNNPKLPVVRKNLQFEVLQEILEGKRYITCHSYIQSEINMLINVSKKMGFKVNTFTHILEGYKLAKELKENNIAASTFSDWSAYKFEVKDAIPFNASLMTEKGVLVALNSDDAEMQSRLNQEAAKTVKYGNTSQTEAWKMVTYNPAKMLHLDDKVGSLKIGKDADIVLWSGNPLSVYSKPEKTMIEGKFYFEIEKDSILRNEIEKERLSLLKKMLGVTDDIQKVQPNIKEKHRFHCNDEF